MKEKRPGVLSKELKEALGMPDNAPPPWLINMQHHGPPPSYPHLKIPGLNAPIPPGAEYGYHPGGWGRPPIDEHGRPIFSEVYAEDMPRARLHDIVHWGVIQPRGEDESSEEEVQESLTEQLDRVIEVPLDDETDAGLATPMTEDGLKTPDAVVLRKKKREEASTPINDGQLYQVLEQKEAHVGRSFYGSDHTYVLDKKKKTSSSDSSLGDRVDLMKSEKSESIDLALDPNELTNLTEERLKKRFDKAMAEKNDKSTPSSSTGGDESTGSDSKKRKRSASDTGKKNAKKAKDFKF
eukprot:TRINITY_DN1802_c0_g1_i2.p1 TRINITY_DN1802_c0_g1~~TRINITY_DN1802_c0_g1_i2.p1  ORF type:complete len:295 (+),score=118.19 TRINITY_DN1802_c0_g1_i2:878-1762(+)